MGQEDDWLLDEPCTLKRVVDVPQCVQRSVAKRRRLEFGRIGTTLPPPEPTPEEEPSPYGALPLEIFKVHILSFLPLRSQINTRRVSRQWKEAVETGVRRLSFRDFCLPRGCVFSVPLLWMSMNALHRAPLQRVDFGGLLFCYSNSHAQLLLEALLLACNREGVVDLALPSTDQLPPLYLLPNVTTLRLMRVGDVPQKLAPFAASLRRIHIRFAMECLPCNTRWLPDAIADVPHVQDLILQGVGPICVMCLAATFRKCGRCLVTLGLGYPDASPPPLAGYFPQLRRLRLELATPPKDLVPLVQSVPHLTHLTLVCKDTTDWSPGAPPAPPRITHLTLEHPSYPKHQLWWTTCPLSRLEILDPGLVWEELPGFPHLTRLDTGPIRNMEEWEALIGFCERCPKLTTLRVGVQGVVVVEQAVAKVKRFEMIVASSFRNQPYEAFRDVAHTIPITPAVYAPSTPYSVTVRSGNPHLSGGGCETKYATVALEGTLSPLVVFVPIPSPLLRIPTGGAPDTAEALFLRTDLHILSPLLRQLDL